MTRRNGPKSISSCWYRRPSASSGRRWPAMTSSRPSISSVSSSGSIPASSAWTTARGGSPSEKTATAGEKPPRRVGASPVRSKTSPKSSSISRRMRSKFANRSRFGGMGLTVPPAPRGRSGGAAVGENGVDRVRDALGAPRELLVGEAEGAVAGGRGEHVPGAVVLEGAARLVVAPAVDLDDEPLVGKQEVDLLARDGLVDPRRR